MRAVGDLCEVVDVLDIALVRTFAIYRHLRWARRPKGALRSRRWVIRYVFMVSVRGFAPSRPI